MEYKWYITPEEYKIAESNGISRETLNGRVRKCGWSIERACTEPLHGQFLKSILTNKVCKNLKKI